MALDPKALEREVNKEPEQRQSSESEVSNPHLPGSDIAVLASRTNNSPRQHAPDDPIYIVDSINRGELVSSQSTRRRTATNANPSDVENGFIEEDDDEKKKEKTKNKIQYKRRNIFNIVKHVFSIIFSLSDVVFDWLEYIEMNDRGNVATETANNTENCEEMGSCIQSAYLIFTIVGSVITFVQIVNIIYQITYECKHKKAKPSALRNKLPKWTKLINEILESFLLLAFVKYGQQLLVMGFYDVNVCMIVSNDDDVVVTKKQVFLCLNGFVSFLRISWRLLTTCKCCTFQKKTIHQVAMNVGIIKPFRCELPCSCCLLQCCPTTPDKKRVEFHCMCKKCLSKENNCGCFVCRIFPSVLSPPKKDILECTCIKCLKCEQNCGCCILRCFPTHLDPPRTEICTGRCRPCLAKECRFKCFTFRCFPAFLNPPETEICTGNCRTCLAKEFPCKCFTFRCFPSFLEPQKEGVWDCHCPECLAFVLPCGCFTFRMCPKYLPGSPDIWTCSCKKGLSCETNSRCCTLRCFPEELSPKKNKWCECTCCRPNTVEPQPQVIIRSSSEPKRCPALCIAISLILLLVLVVLLFLCYVFLVAIHIFITLTRADIEKFGFLNYLYVNLIRGFVDVVASC